MQCTISKMKYSVFSKNDCTDVIFNTKQVSQLDKICRFSFASWVSIKFPLHPEDAEALKVFYFLCEFPNIFN